MNDCSWFASCELDRLSNSISKYHRTFEVRHANNSILAAVQARLSARRARLGGNGSAYVWEPSRRVFLHEESPELIYLHSKLPNFKDDRDFHMRFPRDTLPLETLREWTAAIVASPLAVGAWSRRQHASCAVVGSSAALLRRRHAARIDKHAAVYRMNEAPVERFERYVGRRTTVRVWGAQKMPDLSNRWTDANESIVLYCGPTPWVGECWKSIPTTGRPRLSPFVWEEVNLAIHGSEAEKVKGFPTSGAMALWLALAQCQAVTLFGFGWCDPAEAKDGGMAHDAVYYDPKDTRGKAGFGVHHKIEAEWAWIATLQAQRLVKRAC